MISNHELFNSGLWVDFVSLMANQTSKPAAPRIIGQAEVTPESRESYHLYYCEECAYEAHTPGLMKTHLGTAHRGVTYGCSECSNGYLTKKRRQQHWARVHKNIFTCTMCPKVFTTKEQRDLHVARVHTAEKNCQCPHCPKLFANEHLVSEHKEVHSVACNHSGCSRCSRTFCNQTHRDKHQWKEHGTSCVPLHECNKCDFKHPVADALASHKRKQGH